MHSRVIWCLGMYASASTWMLNAVREIQVASGGMDLATQFVRESVSPVILDGTHAVSVIKSHEIIDETTQLAIAGRCDTILMSIRDPLDAVASVMEYQKMPFARALELVRQSSALCLDYMKDRRTTCFIYETKFFDDPATLFSLARLMGVTLPRSRAGNLQSVAPLCSGKTDRGAAQQAGVLQDLVSGDYLDPVTQWHSHHAGRSGQIGRWRQRLSAEEALEIQRLPQTERVSRLLGALHQ